MDTKRLGYFVKIVDSGSINRAAQMIGVAQPALSQHLAILEHELKTRLLDRSPNGVKPTEAGNKFYARAQVILRQLDSLRMELALEGQTASGVVAVGMPPSLGASLGNPLLVQTRANHPHLRLRIQEELAASLALHLQQGQLDLSVSAVRIFDTDLKETALFDEKLLLLAAPRFVGDATDLAALAALPWIVTGSTNAIRGQLTGLLSQAGLQPNIIAEVNSLPMAIKAVQDGLGVTLLPKTAVSEQLLNGSLIPLNLLPRPLTRTIYLYSRRGDIETTSIAAVHEIILTLSEAHRLSL